MALQLSNLFHCLVFCKVSIRHSNHLISCFSYRLCDFASCQEGCNSTYNNKDKHNNYSFYDTLHQCFMSMCLILSNNYIQIINPYASTHYPIKWLIVSCIVNLWKLFSLIWLCKHKLGIATAFLHTIFNHLLNELVSRRICEVPSWLSLCISTQKNYVDTFWCINPEISISIIISKLANNISRLLFSLCQCHFAILVSTIHNRADTHCFFCLML